MEKENSNGIDVKYDFKINDQISGNIKIGSKSKTKKETTIKIINMRILAMLLFKIKEILLLIIFHGLVNQSHLELSIQAMVLLLIMIFKQRKYLMANTQLDHFLI